MANDYFSFKQFRINQGKCAMKVCTDACLFGAWSAQKIREKKSDVKSILDIGSGTGLLSLMLAQKVNAKIDAVESDHEAAVQSEENFASSPWKQRLKVIQGRVQSIPLAGNYSFIISNPPFYQDQLSSPDQRKNAAMHDSDLTLEELINIIKENLANDGFAAVLLPFYRTGVFEQMVNQKCLYLSERSDVRQTSNHPPFRSMLLFSENKSSEILTDEIIIKDNESYTEKFKGYLKDYYLRL